MYDEVYCMYFDLLCGDIVEFDIDMVYIVV